MLCGRRKTITRGVLCQLRRGRWPERVNFGLTSRLSQLAVCSGDDRGRCRCHCHMRCLRCVTVCWTTCLSVCVRHYLRGTAVRSTTRRLLGGGSVDGGSVGVDAMPGAINRGQSRRILKVAECGRSSWLPCVRVFFLVWGALICVRGLSIMCGGSPLCEGFSLLCGGSPLCEKALPRVRWLNVWLG